MKTSIAFVLIVLGWNPLLAQDEGWDDWGNDSSNSQNAQLFFDTRVVNGHSVETLEQGTFDLRISHRFGDAGVSNSGRTLFGIDVAADIRIALEYGILDNLMIGFGRSKGAGPYTEVWDGLAKCKILSQGKNLPVSLSFNLGMFFTSMQKDGMLTSPTYFKKSAHRFSYSSQLIVARKFADVVTVQLTPTYVHRNLVAWDDENGLFSLGGVVKLKVYKKVSVIAEYFLNTVSRTIQGVEYVNPLAAGIEFKTFAHNFQIVFMNSRGLGETQFIPLTSSRWLDGQFRLGFTISRHF